MAVTHQRVYQALQRALTRLGLEPVQRSAETRLLLKAALGASLEDVFAYPDALASEASLATLRALLRRRLIDRAPAQYLAGEAGFYGLTLAVSPDTLIPRPETERLVDAALTFLSERPEASRVLEIGTGSGAVILALADRIRARPAIRLVASDICPRALSVAQGNAETLGLSDRVVFACGDLFAPFAQERFDLILCNPPYIDPALAPTLAPEVRRHEPARALFAPDQGYGMYARLFRETPAHLSAGGRLALELGDGMAERVTDIARAHGFEREALLTDLAGKCRTATFQQAHETA